MKKGSIFLLKIVFILIIFAISMIHVSGVSAEEVIWQGCTGDVFGLVIQGDRREDFELDATHMAEVIEEDLKGTLREFHPPARGEGIVDAPAEIRQLLSELINAGMEFEDTLIVTIHTHGEAHQGGPPLGGLGNGKLKLELGYDEDGWPTFNTEWEPYKEIQWEDVTAGKIIIHIDTCHAEVAGRRLENRFRNQNFSDKEIAILAGAKMDEVAGAGEAPPGGFFTNAVIDEMRERGIKYLASPAAVADAFSDIAERAFQSSKDAGWISCNETEQRLGVHPRIFTLNIDVIDEVFPNVGLEGETVMVRGGNFGFPLQEGEYTDNPNEDIQVSFCQTQTAPPPTQCYRGLVAEITSRTNTQIIVKVPDDFEDVLDTQFPVYLCINENGKVISSLRLGEKGEFKLLEPPEITSISPNVVPQGSFFGVRGVRFRENCVVIADDWLPLKHAWLDDDYMLVVLPPPGTTGFYDGEHTLKVRRGNKESQSVPFTVGLPQPVGDLPNGWTITVTQQDMSNRKDDHEISLYEAMLLAETGGLPDRTLELHLLCEKTGECEYQQREVDFVSGFLDSEGNLRPGGPGYKDTINVTSGLSGHTMFVDINGLPPIGNGDWIDFHNIILDGEDAQGNLHGLFLKNGASNIRIKDVTLLNFHGDGIHIGNDSIGNDFHNITIKDVKGHGILINGNSVQNAFSYTDQDILDFVPNISNTGGHGIYLTGGANRNSFRHVFISDPNGSGIFLEGHAEENHFDKMVVTDPNMHGIHLSGTMVRFNRAIVHKTGKLSDLEAAWDLEDVYQKAGGYGILIDNGAHSNTLGPNRVFLNHKGGIRLDGPGTESNIIGKRYRTEPYNEGAILPSLVYENKGHGIHISNGARRNIIELMNVAGNQGDAIFIEGPNTTMNRISGIWTGFYYFFTELTEPFSKPNTGNSVHIANGAHWNMIGGYSIMRNNFSNDALNGILIEGPETHHNIVQHTDIGRTPIVTLIGYGKTFDRQLAGVGKSGIAIINGAHDNTIGSMDTSMRIHIDASPDAGILIDDSDDNLVLACYLGSPYEYIEFEECEKNRIGIHIRNGAKGNQIGQIGPMIGPDPSPVSWTGIVDRLNQISHTREAGIWIEDAGGEVEPNGDRVQPNVLHNNDIASEGIGLKISGDSRVNDIGGWKGGPKGDFINIFESFTQEDNSIQGNEAGVQIHNVAITNPAERNRFLNNTISSEVDDEDPADHYDLRSFPPKGVGVLITGNSYGNIIGESSEAPNRIHMNRVGVYIDGPVYPESAQNNMIRGNKIGSVFVPNSITGIVIRGGWGNQIGGRSLDESNILEGNGLLDYGFQGPTTNPDASGILIVEGQSNIVQGNEILDTSGDGILLINTSDNIIGGPKKMSGNIITNSTRNGISIKGSGSANNIIQRNLIGMNWNSDQLGNGADGIYVSGGAYDNLIGGRGSITEGGTTYNPKVPNIIAHNARHGVHVSGAGTNGNSILYNSIFNNGGQGISNVNSGNDELPPPTNMIYKAGEVTGEVVDINTVPAGSIINVFIDSNAQGEIYSEETTVNSEGEWSVSGLPWVPPNKDITATVTHVGTGSTSEFALAGVERAFNIVRADGLPPGQKEVTFGQGDISLLVVKVMATEDSVRVDQLTLKAEGSLLDHMHIDGVNIYRDNDRNGHISAADSLIAGPFTFNEDDGQVDMDFSNIIVLPDDLQQWIIVYQTSQAVQDGTTFSIEILSASDVDAVFLSGEAAIPPGPFPVASDEFMVGLELETFYLDTDSDGFGDPNVHYMSMIMPIGYAQNNLDCDDSDPNTYPEAPELCDGKDNDCDDLVDEENAIGCTVYYKDADGDHYGVDEDSRCLCDPDFNNQYTATLGGDPNDSNPDIKPEITVNMALNAGWSMISLPVEPVDATIQTLFPDAIAVFRFTSKYELLNNTDSLVKSEGYWIYLPDADNYSVTGLPVDSYINPNAPSGWSMIGGCSYPSQISVSTGFIRAVFGFNTKYDLIGSGNNVGPIEPGKGYWLNLSERSNFMVSQ